MLREIKRGDIYYADLCPVIGSEQGGVRPVLIIQNNAGNHFSPTVIAAAISSRQRKHTLPTHVALRGQDYGLRGWSMVLLEQIRTIDRSRLLAYIGKLDPERMEAVDEALTVSVGLGTAREMEGKRSLATGWRVNADEWKKRERGETTGMEEKEIQAVRDILYNSDGKVGFAYLYPKDEGEKEGYVFDMTPFNIANFIGSHQSDADTIILTDMLDRQFLETDGGFLYVCPDQELRREILTFLDPIKRGEQEPQEIPMVDKETYEAYERWEDRTVTAAELGMLP